MRRFGPRPHGLPPPGRRAPSGHGYECRHHRRKENDIDYDERDRIGPDRIRDEPAERDAGHRPGQRTVSLQRSTTRTYRSARRTTRP
jgi:hypothetical protein